MVNIPNPFTGTENSKKGGEEGLPGDEHRMRPKPDIIHDSYLGSQKLKGKVAIITGADSGIGRSVAVHYAREGARGVAISYLEEHKDAEETKAMVEQEGAHAILIPGDVGNSKLCKEIVDKTVQAFGQIDILVNNAAEQIPHESILDLPDEQLEHTYRTNIFAYFYLCKAVVPHLKEGSSIIMSASVQAYKGNPNFLDYSSTKGAIVTFTRSLSLQLAPKQIRVNGVAPGPIWTPLIPASMEQPTLDKFGSATPLGRKGQPSDCGPSYVFLACEDSAYFSGQVLHPNGGTTINT